MAKDYDLNPGDQLPAFWLKQIQEMLASVSPNLRVKIKPGTVDTLQLAATPTNQMGATIGGLWRYISASVNAVHPGGAAGAYDIILAATANVIVSTPAPYTDNTTYQFYMYIMPSGTVPSGTAPNGLAIAATRFIGTVNWDGTQIVALHQVVGADDTTVPIQPTAPGPHSPAGRFVGAVGQVSDILRVDDSDFNPLFEVDPDQAQLHGDLHIYGVVSASALSTISAIACGGPLTVGGTLTVVFAASLGSGSTVAADPAPTDDSGKLASTRWTNNAIESAVAQETADREAADAMYWQPGDVKLSAGAGARAGWVPCDGASYLRTGGFANLFGAIGTSFGAVDSTHFNVPDMRGSVPIGAGQAPSLANRVLATQYGQELTTLVSTQMPVHNHAITDPTHAHGVFDAGHEHQVGDAFTGADAAYTQIGTTAADGGTGARHTMAYWSTGFTVVRALPAVTGIGVLGASTGISVQNAGGSSGVTQGHPNLQPSLALSYYIKL